MSTIDVESAAAPDRSSSLIEFDRQTNNFDRRPELNNSPRIIYNMNDSLDAQKYKQFGNITIQTNCNIEAAATTSQIQTKQYNPNNNQFVRSRGNKFRRKLVQHGNTSVP